MERTKVYAQPVTILTRVNNCENKIGIIVYTYKPLTNKATNKKVFNFIKKEFEIEGMYAFDFNIKYMRTYDIENIRKHNIINSCYRYLIE
jgi:hypothetical protein